MIYSVAGHGHEGARYDGVYLKEAETSRALADLRAIDPLDRPARHFLFGGGDYCYEVLSHGEPIIRSFASRDEAYAWDPSAEP